MLNGRSPPIKSLVLLRQSNSGGHLCNCFTAPGPPYLPASCCELRKNVHVCSVDLIALAARDFLGCAGNIGINIIKLVFATDMQPVLIVLETGRKLFKVKCGDTTLEHAPCHFHGVVPVPVQSKSCHGTRG